MMKINSIQQVIILNEVLSELLKSLKLDSTNNCFKQEKPLEIKFELSHFREIEKLKKSTDTELNNNTKAHNHE